MQNAPKNKSASSTGAKTMNEEKGIFLPIPSSGAKYEIDKDCRVRNAKTKQILKVYKNSVNLYCGQGKTRHVSVFSLLWEVWGVIPKRKFSPPRVPVSVTQGNRVFHFDTLNDCADFLTKEIFFSKSWIIARLCRRVKELEGFKIRYHQN